MIYLELDASQYNTMELFVSIVSRLHVVMNHRYVKRILEGVKIHKHFLQLYIYKESSRSCRDTQTSCIKNKFSETLDLI